MSSVPLGLRLHTKLERLFPPEQRAEAIALLETECGDKLPLIEKQGVEGMERIRCAVLKLSQGSLETLQASVRSAQIDWRDVLVAAGFAHDPQVHLAWLEENSEAGDCG